MRTTMDDEIPKHGCDCDLHFGEFPSQTNRSKTRDKISNNTGLTFYHTMCGYPHSIKHVEIKVMRVVTLHNLVI